ncbi:hypothetical protein K440DRAFT_227587 [Wilcoxina mikolae CBS 423.85]|nr:hypothetical protein K440DRAFT_227587 [Wilcoxina mikolae CBS 423.85]
MEKPKERSKKNKKPYHFKKSDLDLDEYKKEIRDQSPGYLVERAIGVLKTSRQFHLYVILQVLAACLGFGQIMMSIGMYTTHPLISREEHPVSPRAGWGADLPR